VKACLKQLPTSELILNDTLPAVTYLLNFCPWEPVVDGVDMPEYPMTLYKTGRTNNVPIMAGSNTDESNWFFYTYFYQKGYSGMNRTQFTDWFPHIFSTFALQPVSAQEIEEVKTLYQVDRIYEGEDNKSLNIALASQILTDLNFQCKTYITGQEYKSDFWLYRFNHRSACLSLTPVHGIPGVFHQSEVQYVWDAQFKKMCILTPEENHLSHRMQGMWANFSKCLDPTCGGTSFPKYTNSSRKALVFDTPADVVEDDYRGAQCDLWNRVIYERYRGVSGGPSFMRGILI
jgi:para-nitrobenzyl esterase